MALCGAYIQHMCFHDKRQNRTITTTEVVTFFIHFIKQHQMAISICMDVAEYIMYVVSHCIFFIRNQCAFNNEAFQYVDMYFILSCLSVRLFSYSLVTSVCLSQLFKRFHYQSDWNCLNGAQCHAGNENNRYQPMSKPSTELKNAMTGANQVWRGWWIG